MSPRLPALALALLLAAPSALLAAEPGARVDAAEARAIAGRWLDGLGAAGLVLDATLERGGFVVSHAAGPRGPITRFQLLRPGWSLLLGFAGEHTATTPPGTLRSAFRFAALDRLPTPGLEIPGWEVWPATPTSSINRGVEIVAHADGRIRLRVRTPLFALQGRDPSVMVPADAPAPAGSFFQIRRPFPLDLRLDAPVLDAELGVDGSTEGLKIHP
jgi:hypothetical protein